MDQLLAIRVFVRIAEAGAFSKAAESLKIPRTSVSKLVRDLERHLGTKLLQRTTRRVSVTRDGAAYYERATRLMGELDEMDESAAKARSQHRGRLRVDVGSALANVILIPALPAFRARHPDIQVDLDVSDRQVDVVGEGVDCIIRLGAPADGTLVARRIADLDYVTCASPLYFATRGVPRHPSELAAAEDGAKDKVRGGGHAIVGYLSALTGKAVPLEFQRAQQSLAIQGHTVVAVNESTAHLSALLTGMGIGQTYRFMAAPHLADGRLKSVLEDWTRPRHSLNLVYPSNRQLNAKLRVFADWVAEVFAPFDGRKD